MISAYEIGLAVQMAGADSGIWITKALCRCDSCPSGAEVKAYPPCRWVDIHRCEAGIKGGNPELGREPRRAELKMDRNTNPCLTVVILDRLTQDEEPAPKTGMDAESGGYLRRLIALSHASRQTVGSFFQRKTKPWNKVTPVGLSGA